MSPPEYASLSGPRRLGDRLLEAGLITRSELDRALERQEEAGEPHRPLGRTLVELGILAERDLLPMLSAHLAMPILPFRVEEADERAVRLLPPDLARRYRALPCRLANGALVVAASGPLPPAVLAQLEGAVGIPVLSCLAPDGELEAALARREPAVAAVAASDATPGASAGDTRSAAADPGGAAAQDPEALARENARLRAELDDLRAATETLLIGLLDRVRDFLDHHRGPARNGGPPGS